jgi:4-amino-4-deoxy-L-arabinose transferase-like glycosyltransferase
VSTNAKDPCRTWIIGLFVGGLILRLLHLATVYQSPLFNYLFIDPKMYDEWGLSIARGQLLGQAPFFLDPLYPYFIGGVYAAVGRSYLAVAMIQSLLGALVAPLLFDAARRWFDRPVPQLAGIIAAIYQPSIYYGAILLKPGLAVFLVALFLWLLAKALQQRRPGIWIATGAALGLVVLSRTNLLLVVPVLAIAVLFSDRTAGEERSWRVLYGSGVGAVLAGVAIVLAFPAAHNWAASREFVLTTTNWGQIYFIGNNADNPTGRFEELSFVRSNPVYEQTDFKREAERRAGKELSHGAVSRFWFTESWKWVRSHPADWLAVQWSKLRLYWGGYEMPASQDYYLYRRSAALLRAPLPGFGLLGPFGLLGTALAFGRRGWPRMLAIYTIASSLAVVLFFVLTRFRVVIVPALFVLAAFGAVELVRRWREATRRAGWAPALGLTGLLLIFFVFVNIPVRATADCWSYRLANAIGLPTHLETTANAHFNLGVTYAARAKEAENPEEMLGLAEAELRAALEDEAQFKTHVELGKVLARQRRDEEAIEAYKQAVALQPYDYRSRHALGLLHRRVGDLSAAEAAFREALRAEPRHAASAVRLGELLMQQGRAKEAADLFRYALRLKPDDRAARVGLAAAESR